MDADDSFLFRFSDGTGFLSRHFYHRPSVVLFIPFGFFIFLFLSFRAFPYPHCYSICRYFLCFLIMFGGKDYAIFL